MKAIDICNNQEINQKSVVNNALQALIALILGWIDKRGKIKKILGFICPIARYMKKELQNQLLELKAQESEMRMQGKWTL